MESPVDLVTRTTITSEKLPGTTSSPISSTDMMLLSDTPDSNDTKRRSWLYKSLIKPIKKTSKSTISNKSSTSSTDQEDAIKSPAASIADEYYRTIEQQQQQSTESLPFKSKINTQSPLHTRSNSSHVTGVENATQNPTRRHSFDSLQPFKQDELINEDLFDPQLAQWDQERKQTAHGYGYEERPTFHLAISTDNLHQHEEMSDDEFVDAKKTNTGTNTPVIVIDEINPSTEDTKEEQVVFMFDYYSLPVEVKSLIDSYEHKGKAERKKMIVRYKKKAVENEEKEGGNRKDEQEDNEEEEDEDEFEEEEDEDETIEDTVDYRDLITGNCIDKKTVKDTRDIGKRKEETFHLLSYIQPSL